MSLMVPFWVRFDGLGKDECIAELGAFILSTGLPLDRMASHYADHLPQYPGSVFTVAIFTLDIPDDEALLALREGFRKASRERKLAGKGRARWALGSEPNEIDFEE